MENYIGKICPFCKAEITETDTVKVCSACGIPHHEDCWNENHGCTTFGCSEQNSVQQQAAPASFCANCGAPMGDGQMFCGNCGASKPSTPKQNLCGNCGAELQDGQEFCGKCGYKAGVAVDGNVNAAINEFNASIDKMNEAKAKKPTKWIIAAVAAVAAILIGVFAIPKIFVSVEDLCAKGDYEKAYEKADASEKKDVIAENNVAVCSAITVDNLKDAKSFELREAWYNTESGYVVLKVAANNSYGNTVINYWLFSYDHETDKEWELWEAYVDMERKEYSAYDDDDEFIEKLYYNVGIGMAENTMINTYKLDKSSVNRINDLFEDDKLDDVDHIHAAIPEKKESSD